MRIKGKWCESISFQAKQSELNLSLNTKGYVKIIDKYFIDNYKIASYIMKHWWKMHLF